MRPAELQPVRDLRAASGVKALAVPYFLKIPLASPLRTSERGPQDLTPVTIFLTPPPDEVVPRGHGPRPPVKHYRPAHSQSEGSALVTANPATTGAPRMNHAALASPTQPPPVFLFLLLAWCHTVVTWCARLATGSCRLLRDLVDLAWKTVPLRGSAVWQEETGP